ncbi:MAG: cysteine--tRNA ligase [Candidatus Micrarchaeota archaeon]|nr:cysteine--tRNA ligase [Candidatus Micrarchaeota archaeon]
MLVYNTLSRKLEYFKPLNDNEVRMYCCGPTVYNYAHLGNLRAFAFYDIVRRTLLHKGYRVKFVMNITDVDDKTIKGSQAEKISLKEFTDRYTEIFFKDLETLNIKRADVHPKATEHINEMVDLIKKLMNLGIAYKGSDGSIYYRVSSFKDYGKLSHVDISQLKAGASGRVSADEYAKDQVFDFALWKAWTPEDGDVYWDTELGRGRPGWHIECSAMSMKYLGESFDIHCGGVDLIFPHHENEIAQAEGATGKPFVKYWLHNAHILINGQKMSKSLGNFWTLKDVLEKGVKPEAVRYLFVSSHYREQLNLTLESLEAAQNAVNRIYEFIRNLDNIKSEYNNPDIKQIIDDVKHRFDMALENDFNTPQAIAVLFEFIKEINILIMEGAIGKDNAREIKMAMYYFDEVLGILDYMKKKEPPISKEEIERLIADRNEARKRKDFAKADEIRNMLKEKGIILEDTKDGTIWKLA